MQAGSSPPARARPPCPQLARLVAENIVAIDKKKFWMRVATRNDTASSPEVQKKLPVMAEAVMLVVDTVMKKTEQQLSDSGKTLQVRGPCAAAAHGASASWLVPMAAAERRAAGGGAMEHSRAPRNRCSLRARAGHPDSRQRGQRRVVPSAVAGTGGAAPAAATRSCQRSWPVQAHASPLPTAATWACPCLGHPPAHTHAGPRLAHARACRHHPSPGAQQRPAAPAPAARPVLACVVHVQSFPSQTGDTFGR